MNQFAISMTILLALLIGGGYQAYRNAAQEVAAHEAHAEAAEGHSEEAKGEKASEKPAETAKTEEAKPATEAKPEAETKPATEAEPVAAKGDVSKGQEMFATSCQGCHGANGAGGFGPKLADSEVSSWTFAQFKTALAEGKTPARELSSQMPRFADKTDADLENLQAYIKSL